MAYCRLRQAFCDFRLDRILQLDFQTEVFAVRPEILQQYWADAAHRWPTEKVVLRYQPAAVLPALAQHLHATKY